jgi:phage recombination protein Bet
MSNELAAVKAAPLVSVAGFTPEQVDLIKRTVAVGATDDELALFMHVCTKSGLDPFAKQIYAIKRWNADAGREVMAFQTGIDGFRLVAARTNAHAGTDEAVFDEKDGKPIKASVTVWKIVAGTRVPFTASARWSEYVQTKKDGSPVKMWGKMQYTMLGKCAEALALRKAFPADLSGIYANEEMAQADNAPVVTVPVTKPAAVVVAPAKQTNAAGTRADVLRLFANGGKGEIMRVLTETGRLADVQGKPVKEWSDEIMDLVWRHAGPLGNEPIPAKATDTVPPREPGCDDDESFVGPVPF